MRTFPAPKSWVIVAGIVLAVFLGSSPAPGSGPEPDLVVHEWGTFTSLQDEMGRELGGVNIDDEPVPSFVHNLSPFVVNATFLTERYWRMRMKGVPRHHPRLTMRLETPVVYFHVGDDVETPIEVDVRVRYRGGWLTEFYPRADAEAPGLSDDFRFGELKPGTVSSLTWSGLRVGARGSFPVTNEHVWTTPRQVDAAPVTTPEGESEQYLFYRGVARLRAPVRIVEADDGRSFRVQANFGEVRCSESTRIPAMWLVHIRGDGKAAFRQVDAVDVTSNESATIASIKAGFDSDDYHASSVRELKARMWAALTTDGLHGDEATAMLDTWQRAYFESPGRRVFFLVPQEWTDHYLPLEVSAADRIERVMMGRIELITERQREILRRIATGPVPDASWVDAIPESPARDKFIAGRSNFGDLGVEIPEHYRSYLDLGRFRNALLAEEERRRPTPTLTAFIDAYGLRPYRWEEKDGEAKKE